MPEEKKAAGLKPCHEASQVREGETQATRTRAPDQDVLPGILGKQLRAAYGELLSSPIPDAFNDLIKRLENKEAGMGQDTMSKPPLPEEGDQ